MTKLKLDLKGFTPKQYAALILRDDLNYSYARAGLRMDLNRYAFRELYKRAEFKQDMKDRYANFSLISLQKES